MSDLDPANLEQTLVRVHQMEVEEAVKMANQDGWRVLQIVVFPSSYMVGVLAERERHRFQKHDWPGNMKGVE